MTTTVIDQLIQDQQQAQARAQQELQHRLQQQLQQAGQDLVQALADIGLQDFWATIADVGYETKIETAGTGHPSTGSGRRNKRVSELILQVPLSEDLQLAGFQIKYSLPRGTISFTDGQAFWHQRDPNFTISLKATELPDIQQPLGAFLHDRRQAYLQYRERKEKEAEEAHAQRIRDLQTQLRYYRVETPACASHADRPDEAQQIFDELMELEPDNADTWDELLVGWRGRHDIELQQAAEEKQRKIQAQAYEAAYRDYYATVQEIRARNYERLEALQAELDQPFTVWQLEYGIVAHEDGESYADTASVDALEEPPAKPGMCRVFAGNVTGVVEKYIYHPVTWRELTTRPTDEKAYRVLTHHEPYFRLMFHPEVDKAQVEAMIAERLEPEPDPPKAGRLLSEHDRRRIQERTMQDPDYVPF